MVEILFAYDQFTIRDDQIPDTHVIRGNSGNINNVAEVVSISVHPVKEQPIVNSGNNIYERTYEVEMAYLAGPGFDVVLFIQTVDIQNIIGTQTLPDFSSIRETGLNLTAIPIRRSESQTKYHLFFPFTGDVVFPSVRFFGAVNQITTLDGQSESSLLLDGTITNPVLHFHDSPNSQKAGDTSLVDVFYYFTDV